MAHGKKTSPERTKIVTIHYGNKDYTFTVGLEWGTKDVIETLRRHLSGGLPGNCSYTVKTPFYTRNRYIVVPTPTRSVEDQRVGHLKRRNIGIIPMPGADNHDKRPVGHW